MLLAIRNYTEADRYSASALAAMAVGTVVKVQDDGTGLRAATPLLDTDAAQLHDGSYGVAFKVSTDPYQVSRTTAPSFTGIRTVSINAGEMMVVVVDAYLEFDPSLLDASLDPARAGTLPAVGDKLAIKGSLLCAAAVAGAITTPVIARVHEVAKGVVTIHITETPA